MAAALDFFKELLSKVTLGFILPVILNHNIDKALLSGPKSIQELTANTQINPERLHRLLTHLESNGLFSFDPESQTWSHTELSTALANPLINAMCNFEFSPHFLENFLHLDKVLESDQSVYHIQGKGSFFEDIKKDPSFFQTFHTWMKESTNAFEEKLVNAFDLTGINSLLDVGGANGSLCIALNKRFPETQFGVYDLAECEAIARNNIKDHGLIEKIQVLTGSFLESVPENFDAITMKIVLHDWPDEAVLSILKNCRNALETGKKLFIVELLLDKSKPDRFLKTTYDIRMMVAFNGKERSKEEFDELLSKNSFRLEKVIEAEVFNIIEAIAV